MLGKQGGKTGHMLNINQQPGWVQDNLPSIIHCALKGEDRIIASNFVSPFSSAKRGCILFIYNIYSVNYNGLIKQTILWIQKENKLEFGIVNQRFSESEQKI